MSALQLTILAKSGGPLTKRLSLAENGLLIDDGSACVMSAHTARHFEFSRLHQVATLIEQLQPHQAIALGRLRPGLPDQVEVVSKRKLNGGDHANLICQPRIDINGKPIFNQIIEFRGRATADRFSPMVIALVCVADADFLAGEK